MSQVSLRVQFQTFLESTRELMLLEGDERARREKELEGNYRQLQTLFRNLSDEQARSILNQASDEASQVLMEHLVLGREQVRSVQRPIAKLIDADPQRTDWAVSSFMTTLAAYSLIQDGRSKAKRAQKAELDEKARLLLAGMLGVEGYELTGEFARKVRGELMAGTIAYAHSGLCKRDVKAWEEDLSIQHKYSGDIETYLCDCITRANRPLFYKLVTQDEGPDLLSCVFLEHSRPILEGGRPTDGMGATAVKLQADAFCVNHDRKVFIVGATTTNDQHDAKQMESLVRNVKALEFLKQTDPRFKDYKIQPFFFHSGYFCASAEGATGVGRDFVEKMRNAGMPQPHIEALAQMAFFNLLSEKHPSPEAGRVFLLTNPHVAGCDTLDLFYASERAQRSLENQDNSRSPAIAVLKSLEQAAEALASPLFEVSKSGPRESLIYGLHRSLDSFYTCFPLAPGEFPNAEEQAVLKSIGAHMAVVTQKVVVSKKFGDIDWGLRDQSKRFSNPTGERMEDFLDLKAESNPHKGQYAASEELYAQMAADKKLFDVDPEYVASKASNFLASTYTSEHPEVPAILSHAMAACLSPDGPYLDQLDRQTVVMLERAHEELKDLVEDAKKGYKRSPSERDGGMGTNESFVQSFRNAAVALEKNQAGEPSVPSALLRMMGAVFQMDHREFSGEVRSEAFRRNGPAFVQACLASGQQQLGVLALATMDNATPHAELPTARARKTFGMR